VAAAGVLLALATLVVIVTGAVVSPAGATNITPTVVVANTGTNSLTSYPATASGNTAPTATVTPASLNGPYQEAFDASGNLWVTSATSNTILKFSYSQLVTGSPTPVATISLPTGTGPEGLVFDASGDLWVIGTGNSTVLEFSPAQIAASGTPSPVVTLNTAGVSGAFDSSGDLWITNNAGNTVSDFTPSQLAAGGAPTPAVTLSSNGTPSIGGPWGLAFDSTGALWVSNSNITTLIKFTPSQLASSGSPTPAVTISNTGADLVQVAGISFDASGDLWTTNPFFNRIAEFTPGQLAASGSPTPNQITGASTGLHSPMDVVIAQAPTVTSISPSTGYTNGSTTVTINGAQYAPGSQVFFGSTPATSVTWVSPYVLTAVAPPGTGTVDVTVTDFAGTSTTSGADQLTYVSPPSPPLPGTPTLSGGSIVFPWSAVTGATSYTVTVYLNGVAQSPVTGLTGLSYTLSSPLAGATYYFTVAAVTSLGSTGNSANSSTVATPPSASGYWTVAGDGGVFSFGPNFYGSTGNLRLNQPVFAITSTSDGKGYWFVARDGGVFTYGDGVFHGSVPALGVHVTNIVGMAADTATGGYWLVGADGGVYAFGAPFDGSIPGLGQHLSNIVGMAATADGGGYYLVSSTGAVYAFGDAKYQGGANTLPRINAPIVGITVNSATGGYWLAGSDGGIYAYGAPFYGSAGGAHLNQPVVGIAATTSGSGYYLVASDGGVFSYNAPFLGSMGGKHLNAPMVGIAVAGTGTAPSPSPTPTPTTTTTTTTTVPLG
jgi:sugar lactone lactonase YvrE